MNNSKKVKGISFLFPSFLISSYFLILYSPPHPLAFSLSAVSSSGGHQRQILNRFRVSTVKCRSILLFEFLPSIYLSEMFCFFVWR